jgi:DNA-binding MarR family transcriptional regulator
MLKFNGSVWANMDIALRNLNFIFRLPADSGVPMLILERYIMRALYEHDGQHASNLARAVGRAATSFTPLLDKLQEKGLIERRLDLSDRRAIYIYLTDAGKAAQDAILDPLQAVDERIEGCFDPEDWKSFLKVLAGLQNISLNQPDADA